MDWAVLHFSYIYNNSGTSFATNPEKDRIARPVLSLHINSWYPWGIFLEPELGRNVTFFFLLLRDFYSA